MATWRGLISDEMECNRETWADVEACTLSDDGLNAFFYDGYGGAKGQPFTLWTKSRVYFPVVYDGLEWVGSVPRDPSDEACKHFGGQ